MPTFQYKAKSKSAETVYGAIVAENRDLAIEKVHELGLLPVLIEDEAQQRKQKQRFVTPRLKSNDLYFFSRQLVTLLKSGIPILQALNIIGAQIRDVQFKDVIEDVGVRIKEGKSFSDTLAEYPRFFSSLYVAMVKAGEESGSLKETLNEMAEYQKRQNLFNSKVRTALAYPLLMLVFGIGTVIFVLTYVMPKITSLFSHLDQALPGPTIFVMKVSLFILDYWFWILGIAVASVVLIKQTENNPGVRLFKSRVKLSTPFLGNFLLKVDLTRFCRSFELLLKSGLPILQSLNLSVAMISNDIIRRELEKSKEDLAAGKSLGESIKKIKVIPPLMGHLIAVGEESGAIASTLHEISEAFEQETEETIKIITTYLEPFMIIAVGGVVGLIVIAMLLPIFQLDVFANG
jgi:type II secretory pathway component PulF